MQLIQEAGAIGAVVVVVFAAALIARASGRSLSSTPWALSLLALGQIGQSLSQRVVADAIDQVDGTVKMLAVGSAEASANLLLAGACALIVVVIGAARDRLAKG